MLDIEAIKNFSIDKSGWKKVKFGDVVFEPKESVKDPLSEGIEHVVGLEHITSEDIHLRRSASIEESTTFTKRFSKGDVLFGRRRAYLRKAAKANFEGVCSGDITVMRAREELLLPEILPFIVNNDNFFDFAIQYSAGGLSPRVKFKDLANYEFFLPPKKIQLTLLDLLSNLDNTREQESQVNAKLEKSLKSTIHDYTMGKNRHGCFIKSDEYQSSKLGEVPRDWEVVPLGKFCSLMTNGFVGKATPFYTEKEVGIKYIQGMNVRRNRMDPKGMTYINNEFHQKQHKTQLRAGDLLTVQSGHIGETAVVTEEFDGANCHAVIISRLDSNEFNPKFAAYFINSPKGQVKMKGITVGTTVAHVNTSELNRFLIPKPLLEEQSFIVQTIESIEAAIEASNDKLLKLYNLNKSLINKVF